MLGVVVTLCLRDLITSAGISYLLLLGAGTFLFVGLSEIIPEALDIQFENSSHRETQFKKILAFSVGAVLLGLPLMVHQHCEGDDHSHN